MIGDLAAIWNRAVCLDRPTVGDVVALGTAGELKAVFPHSRSIFLLAPNLIVRIPPGTALATDCPVLSISAITVADFFVGSAVETSDLPDFSLLQCIFPCSAQDLLAHVRRVVPAPISLASFKNRWLLHYGDALVLMFFAGERADDPADSRLAQVEFYFQTPYKGAVPPLIRSV